MVLAFATIKEGRTATPDEVELYLNQLKTDLKIGFSSKGMLAILHNDKH